MNTLENTMNSRQVIRIYSCDDKYLYEIIEDFKLAGPAEGAEIFRAFCSHIWACDNKRRVYTKSIKYKVNKNLLDSELGILFDTWSNIEYTYYKSMTKEEDWRYLIRQKINNIYTRYFDPEVILNKEYMELLKTPKKLYYKWLSGTAMEPASVAEQILTAVNNAAAVRKQYQKEKMVLSWGNYKKVTEDFLFHCFHNCIPIDEYEQKPDAMSPLDFLTEDHYYVGYFCRCLDGEIKKWQKKYYGIPQSSRRGYKRCKSCGALIEKGGNKKMYCDACRKRNYLSRYKKYNRTRTTNRKQPETVH